MKWAAIAPDVSSGEVGMPDGGAGEGGGGGGVLGGQQSGCSPGKTSPLVYCLANELMARSGIEDFTVKVALSRRKCWSVSRVIYELKAARSPGGGLSLG